MYIYHEDILEKEDDIINTFFNVILPSIHGISPRCEALMDIAHPSPKVCHTYKDTLEQEDEIIRNFLDVLLGEKRA